MIRMMLLLLALAAGQAANAAQAGMSHEDWDGLLKRNVVHTPSGKSTEVDYNAMGIERKALLAYLYRASQVSKSDFERWPPAAQMAMLINLYNAGTVELIVSAPTAPASIKDLGSLLQSPWKKRSISLFGRTVSLDEIEHGMLRQAGRYQDPRIHFAVNCASIGCPALRQEAYVAERLEAQLDDATARFLSDRSRNGMRGGVLMVSSIFKWYRADFEAGWRGAGGLPQFLALYGEALGLDSATRARLAAGAIPIGFLDYDWRLNGSARGRP